MTGVDLSLSGLASGLDWKSLVEQLAQAERTPQVRLRNDQQTMAQQGSAYTTLKTELSVLQNRVSTLSDSLLFDSRLPNTSDATKATATTDAGTNLGSYTFAVTQLATSAKQIGTLGAGGALSGTNDVSGLVLSTAGFGATVTAGSITVNGKKITIATTDTLQNVFDNIASATSGAVTGGYDATTDRITLTSASPVVLGSATDTSNFLRVSKLNNNGTGTVTSAAGLGVIRLSGSLSTANFTTAIDDGGAGAGQMKINGVSINFAATDTVAGVIKRINDSSAGVTASYDTVNDRFVLSNKTTGDVGMALEDVTGNFLAAAGLSGGTISRGQNLLYTVDGGGQLISQSNTITSDTSGITGLSVTALAIGSTSVTVSSDTSKVKTAINDFITAYNKIQSIIDSQTASTTDAKGKVTAGILAHDTDANEMSVALRRTVTGQVGGLAAVLNQLEDMGIVSNGSDNSIKLGDETKLDAALATNLNTVKTIFSDPVSGMATKLNAYLKKTIGDTGTLPAKQDRLTKQSADIDVQIADLERVVQANRARMITSFTAMETAQSTINQQLKYLTSQFGGSAK